MENRRLHREGSEKEKRHVMSVVHAWSSGRAPRTNAFVLFFKRDLCIKEKKVVEKKKRRVVFFFINKEVARVGDSFMTDRQRNKSRVMELRSKDELHLQQVINNLRFNLLQFNHRIADTILHESPQLNLTSKSNLMNGVGILSLKTIELQKAWEEVNFALKRAGVVWPSQLTVLFPQKLKYTHRGYVEEEEETTPQSPSEEEEEPKPKRTKKSKGETSRRVRKNKSSPPPPPPPTTDTAIPTQASQTQTTTTDTAIPTRSSQTQTTTTIVSSQTP